MASDPSKEPANKMPEDFTKKLKEIITVHEIPTLEFSEFTNPESLDAGAAGEIKKARWREVNVTLKCLTSNFSEVNPDAPKMFLAEIKQLARVKDFRHVIKFHGHTEDYEGIHYIVMEYAEHSNLRSYLMKNPNIDVQEKLRIAKEIAHGLKAIHDEKISHRDLHSKNILLVNGGTVKIADLGLSKKEGSLQDSLMGGMIAFFEPALFDDRDYKRDFKSDIYAFGVLLWEIWACRPPFYDLDANAHAIHLAFDLNNGKRETPIPDTPKAYVGLYQSCWHGNPQKRPTIVDAIEKLENLPLGELWTEVVDSTEQVDDTGTTSLYFEFGMEPDRVSIPGDRVSIPGDTEEYDDICGLVECTTKDDIYELLYHVKTHACKKEEKDKALQSAAEFASGRNLMEIFRRLSESESGASTQIKTDSGETLLHLLVRNRNLSQETFSLASKWLIENNVDVSSQDKDGFTALHLALNTKFDHTIIERINTICTLGADTNSRAKSGITAIYALLYQPDYVTVDLLLKILKILLENNADQNIEIPAIENFPAFPSALFAAIHIFDEVSILQLLIGHQADLSKKMNRLTALEYARKRKQDHSIEYLSEFQKTNSCKETRTPVTSNVKTLENGVLPGAPMGVTSNVKTTENGVLPGTPMGVTSNVKTLENGVLPGTPMGVTSNVKTIGNGVLPGTPMGVTSNVKTLENVLPGTPMGVTSNVKTIENGVLPGTLVDQTGVVANTQKHKKVWRGLFKSHLVASNPCHSIH